MTDATDAADQSSAEPAYAKPDPMLTTAAVVLAAGAGFRFEGDDHKLRTVVRGKPLVLHAVDSARAAGFAEVIVVTGAVDLTDLMPDDVTVLHNERWEDGQSTSLRAAVAYADARGHTAVVVGLGDSPGVTTETWLAVAGIDRDLVAAQFDGQRQPPVKLTAAMWQSLPVSGDEGARAVMRAHPDLVRPVPVDDNPADIDTVEDLRRWK